MAILSPSHSQAAPIWLTKANTEFGDGWLQSSMSVAAPSPASFSRAATCAAVNS